MNKLVLLTCFAVLTAIIYVIRDLRVLKWEYFSRYLIALFCVFAALILSPKVLAFHYLRICAFAVVGISMFIIIVDFLIDNFSRVKSFLPFGNFSEKYILEICKALEEMAKKKIGALIIIEKRDKLSEHIGDSILFDAQVKTEALMAIFMKDSPIHDGAVVINRGRICRVKTILPISTNTVLPMGVGTRHRSAVAITEKSDAIALIASEERGQLSVAYRGFLVKSPSQKEFLKVLKMALRKQDIGRFQSSPAK